jgi:hypothetical protein
MANLTPKFYHLYVYNDLSNGYICDGCGRCEAMPVSVPRIDNALYAELERKLKKCTLPDRQTVTTKLCERCADRILPTLNAELDIRAQQCACPVCREEFGNSIVHIASHAKRCTEEQADIITFWECPVASGRSFFRLHNANPCHLPLIADTLAFARAERLILPNHVVTSATAEARAVYGS